MAQPYVHQAAMHNMDAPRRIVPLIAELLGPSSVVDVGCGLGTFLHAFQECDVLDVLGVDGEWTDRGLLAEHLLPSEFVVADLTEPLDLGREFDLALCLEVGEHLPPESAEVLVGSLVRLSPVVVFSGAIPLQGGQNHVNEQWPSYWIERFAAHGYEAHDAIRPLLWGDDALFVYYRQNPLLFVRAGHPWPEERFVAAAKPMHDIVHPQLYHRRSRQLERLQGGELRIRAYVKLLAKALRRRIRGR